VIPELEDVSNMKKSQSFRWFPHLHSCLHAFILFMFVTGFLSAAGRNPNLWLYFVKLPQQPELLTVVAILLLILPIPAIAFLHHFLLCHFLPVIPGEKIKKVKGFLPGLLSWRESLYGWLVIVLSTLTTTLICTPFLPLFQLNYRLILSIWEAKNHQILLIFAAVWFVSATLFYEIEFLFKTRFFLGNSVVSPSPNQNNLTSPGVPNTSTRSEEVYSANTYPAPELTKFNLSPKSRRLSKQLGMLTLIPLLTILIYFFVKSPDFRQTIPAIVSANYPPPVASQTAKPTDTYEQATNKAKRAAKLAKLAQSEHEWKIVIRCWDEAIALMKSVPRTSSNFRMARQKMRQYQLHREFARQYVADSK
jgi:hypothetical protein